MSRRRVLWYLVPSFLLVLACALVFPAWFSLIHFADASHKRLVADLTARAYSLEGLFHGHFVRTDSTYVDSLCHTLSSHVGARVSVLLISGESLGDSEERPADAARELNRPEVKAARLGQIGSDVRFHGALDQNVLNVAVPVPAGTPTGIIRLSVAVGDIDASLGESRNRLLWGGLVLALLAVGFALLIARRISRPIDELRIGVARFSSGELTHKLPPGGFAETAELADALNQMAASLDQRIRTITHRRNEQEAVLASMIEGVLAIDAEERLINLNGAAAQLLRLRPESAVGKSVQEVVRNSELIRLIRRALNSRIPVEGEFVLADPEERFIQVHGTQLQDPEVTNPGAVIVLHDITTLRRLENLRRDFVANVSHELKTPITSIKGFVETLRDGAIDDPTDGRRFLGIIEKQAERLNSIIEDLLTLSRIEQGTEKAEIYLEEASVGDVLRSALDMCQVRAADKQLVLTVVCDDTLRTRLNGALLEQAVVNLIDNAIKYSEPGHGIAVTATERERQVVIEVADQGCGIATEHLPRLWERFYRVDRARSRSQGGTGLGLAIVKHIALAHGGGVSVESTVGKGSRFRIHLPSSTQRPW